MLFVILISAPFLHELLYERTKDHIRWIQPYKTPIMDKYMRLVSALGDGPPYFYILVLNWATGRRTKTHSSMYEIIFLTFTLELGMQFCYVLKLLYHKSRPYFDDISLGDIVMRDCAAEFGNPSGHSILVASFPLTALWFY